MVIPPCSSRSALLSCPVERPSTGSSLIPNDDRTAYFLHRRARIASMSDLKKVAESA